MDHSTTRWEGTFLGCPSSQGLECLHINASPPASVFLLSLCKTYPKTKRQTKLSILSPFSYRYPCPSHVNNRSFLPLSSLSSVLVPLSHLLLPATPKTAINIRLTQASEKKEQDLTTLFTTSDLAPFILHPALLLKGLLKGNSIIHHYRPCL